MKCGKILTLAITGAFLLATTGCEVFEGEEHEEGEGHERFERREGERFEGRERRFERYVIFESPSAQPAQDITGADGTNLSQ